MPFQSEDLNEFSFITKDFKYERIERGTVYKDNLPVLQNIVSTCNLQTKLDLKKIAMNAKNTEYQP